MANEPARVGIGDSLNPLYAPSGSEAAVRTPVGGGTVSWGPDGGSVKLSAREQTEWDREVGPSRMRLVQVGEASVSLGQARDERADTTSFTVESQFAAVAEAEIAGRGRAAGIAADSAVAAGARARYRVTLPDAPNGEPARPAQALGVNPFDPTTLPVGGQIALDSQAFSQREMQLGFRNIASMNRVTEAQGTGIAVTRLDEHRVRVVAGPNAAVEALQAVGLDTGVARAMVGRQDSLGQSRLQTADFDLREPGAQAAYLRMLGTGQVAHQTPGVGNVASIDRLDFSSQQRLQLGVFDDTLSADLAGRRNTGAQVRATEPNGESTLVQQFQYDTNVPLTITRRYDREGNERIGERSYQFQVDADVAAPGWIERLAGRNEAREERNLAANLNAALGTDAVRAGRAATITFTQAQMQDLMARADATVGRNPVGVDPLALIARDAQGQPQRDGYQFALAMARNLGGDAQGFSDRLMRIASDDQAPGGIRPIQAQVQAEGVRPPAAAPAVAPSEDPRQPGHRQHALYGQCLAGAQALGGLPGLPDLDTDDARERMALGAFGAARGAGLGCVDHLVMGDRGQAFVVQGELGSPAHLRGGFDARAALCTPVEDALRQLRLAEPEPARAEAQAQAQAQQQEPARQGMSR